MCSKCPPRPCICKTAICREQAMVTVKPGVFCDPCIASLVAALNYGGIETVASCCGHGDRDGNIILKDGRELVVREHKPFDGVALQAAGLYPSNDGGS